MEAKKIHTFQSISDNVGQFNLQEKTFLIPEMARIGCHLLAGAFRGFGINAIVIETYKGLDLGKEFTSGKECFPCQVTTGDILYFLKKEKERFLKEQLEIESRIQKTNYTSIDNWSIQIWCQAVKKRISSLSLQGLAVESQGIYGETG